MTKSFCIFSKYFQQTQYLAILEAFVLLIWDLRFKSCWGMTKHRARVFHLKWIGYLCKNSMSYFVQKIAFGLLQRYCKGKLLINCLLFYQNVIFASSSNIVLNIKNSQELRLLSFFLLNTFYIYKYTGWPQKMWSDNFFLILRAINAIEVLKNSLCLDALFTTPKRGKGEFLIMHSTASYNWLRWNNKSLLMV